MRPRSAWLHLSDIPKDVRDSMSQIVKNWELRDGRVESALELIVDDSHARDRARHALRVSMNASRVPMFIHELKEVHPQVSRSQLFRATALFLGLDSRWVQKLFYRRHK
jgi:hypothetical protein